MRILLHLVSSGLTSLNMSCPLARTTRFWSSVGVISQAVKKSCSYPIPQPRKKTLRNSPVGREGCVGRVLGKDIVRTRQSYGDHRTPAYRAVTCYNVSNESISHQGFRDSNTYKSRRICGRKNGGGQRDLMVVSNLTMKELARLAVQMLS